MSLIGVKITVTDDVIAYKSRHSIYLYRSHSPPDALDQQRIIKMVERIFTHTSIWWASKPYLIIKIEDSVEAEFLQILGLKKIFKRTNPKIGYMIDLCELTGEKINRFTTAPDLTCDLSSVTITENMFSVCIEVPINYRDKTSSLANE